MTLKARNPIHEIRIIGKKMRLINDPQQCKVVESEETLFVAYLVP
jgi:hypothetical protein